MRRSVRDVFRMIDRQPESHGLLRHALRIAAASAVMATLACGTSPNSPPTDPTDRRSLATPASIAGRTFETVAYGDVAPRARAVRAYEAKSGSVNLHMTRTTIEGDPVQFYLVVDGERATVVIDYRADRFGGSLGVVEYPLTAMWLARVASGDREPTRVDPEGPFPTGTYVIRGGSSCPGAAPCTVEF